MLETLKAACNDCYSLRGIGPYDEKRRLKINSRIVAIEIAEELGIKEFDRYCNLNCEKARKSIGL